MHHHHASQQQQQHYHYQSGYAMPRTATAANFQPSQRIPPPPLLPSSATTLRFNPQASSSSSQHSGGGEALAFEKSWIKPLTVTGGWGSQQSGGSTPYPPPPVAAGGMPSNAEMTMREFERMKRLETKFDEFASLLTTLNSHLHTMVQTNEKIANSLSTITNAVASAKSAFGEDDDRKKTGAKRQQLEKRGIPPRGANTGIGGGNDEEDDELEAGENFDVRRAMQQPHKHRRLVAVLMASKQETESLFGGTGTGLNDSQELFTQDDESGPPPEVEEEDILA